MAEDHLGQRKETRAPWTKIFTGFKVALDPKKLLLAAAGILAMAVGWHALAWAFYGARTMPQPSDTAYGISSKPDKTGVDDIAQKEAWTRFKRDRQRWNLLHQMAGTQASDPNDKHAVTDAADLAKTLEEYRVLSDISEKLRRLKQVVKLERTDEGLRLNVDGAKYSVTLEAGTGEKLKGDFHLADLVPLGDRVLLVGVPLQISNDKLKELIALREGALTHAQIRQEIEARVADKKVALGLAERALGLDKVKPAGALRTMPWNEYRGPNPYLLVTGNIKQNDPNETRNVPWARGQFLGWLISDQLPVLVEPLVKFLSPILYMFDPGAGGWNRIYLILVILWTLLVWAYFGGAITRMAAVQIARNEKISMREALSFARARCQSFFSAPLFPLVFLGILTLILIVFGLFSGLIPIFGDIVIAGLLWPIVLILGLVMAVVLVGLIGWPLMNPTISAEGSDSFDALSRSYSYVYQAPWHYIGYSLLAMLYGAALVFFVGFMGSLIVYMGQWAVGEAPFLSSSDPAKDREPTYLFVDAPISFGWRDLLLHSSPFAEAEETITPGGLRTVTYHMSKDYIDSMKWYNYVGAFLVNIWIFLLFMLVVGFGYSYFWSASTIIYLLMRRHVDDTEMDEVHLEEEELEEPFGKDTMTPATVTPATMTPATQPGATPDGVTMVEPPTLRAATSPSEPAAPPTGNPEGNPPSPGSP
ncbi:MAG: hypothetical protein HY040_04145 [Planctomycetes bacterium]|nr:hypothetical protein [Planctomycetota bacterium]